LILIGASLWATAPRLIQFGPMRGSLSSANEMVRRTALVELTGLRVLSLAMGLLAIGTILRKPTDMSAERDLRPPPWRRAYRSSRLLNRSLSIIAILLLGAMVYVAIGANWLGQEMYKTMDREDGILETASAALFLVCAALSWWQGRSARTPSRRWILRGIALACLLCCGEEISWGQRILGFQTPEPVAGVNVQGELNLHNLAGYAADHLFIAVVFMGGAVLPLLASFVPRVADWIVRLGWPVPSGGLAIGFLMVSLLHDWTVYAFIPNNGLRIAELRELLSVVGLLLLLSETGEQLPLPCFWRTVKHSV
jgi:hypothetical protein